MKKVLFALLTFAGGAIALPTGNTAYARGDVVTMNGSVAPGTIIVRTNERRLYYVTAMGQAIRYVVELAGQAGNGRGPPISQGNTPIRLGHHRRQYGMTNRTCRK